MNFLEKNISVTVFNKNENQNDCTIVVYYLDRHLQQISVAFINNFLLQSSASPITDARIFELFLTKAIEENKISKIIHPQQNSFVFYFPQIQASFQVPIRERIKCKHLGPQQMPSFQEKMIDFLAEFISSTEKKLNQKIEEVSVNLEKKVTKFNIQILELEKYVKARLQRQIAACVKEFKASLGNTLSTVEDKISEFQEKLSQPHSTILHSIQAHLQMIESLDRKIDKVRLEMRTNFNECRAQIDRFATLIKEQDSNNQAQFVYFDDVIKNWNEKLELLEKDRIETTTRQSIELRTNEVFNNDNDGQNNQETERKKVTCINNKEDPFGEVTRYEQEGKKTIEHNKKYKMK